MVNKLFKKTDVRFNKAGSMKMIFNVKSIGLGVKRELCEGVVALPVTFGAETWCMMK